MAKLCNILFLLLVANHPIVLPSPLGTREKRSAVQLTSLIHSETPYSFVKLSNYGNWCGKGGDRMGDGSTVDGCDLCCKQHDKCYHRSKVKFAGCTHPLLTSYTTTHRNETTGKKVPSCAPQPSKKPNTTSSTPPPHPPGTPSSCAEAICQCDVQFAKCLKKEPCDPDTVSKQSNVWWAPNWFR